MDKINGETFNIGGGLQTSVSLKELTKLCEEISGNKIKIDQVAETRAADLRIYYSDNSKAKRMMDWQPTISVKDIVADTFEWIKQNQTSLESILK
jgi:CDP-paratose 2-epimerase